MDKLAVIIDYKTGHRKDVYTKQVIEYMDALQALGYTETRGIIYYTSLGEIQEV
jgi:CRISPR/Cas system-associated exonuclease Cas4 (RecB family)